MPAGELAQPNPLPAPWMLGCYEVTISNVADHEWMPSKKLRLTNDPAGEDLIKQRYRVIDLMTNISPKFWSWSPVTNDELRVNLGAGFSGWEFRLHGTQKGLQGDGRFWTDMPSRDRHDHSVEFVRSGCG